MSLARIPSKMAILAIVALYFAVSVVALSPTLVIRNSNVFVRRISWDLDKSANFSVASIPSPGSIAVGWSVNVTKIPTNEYTVYGSVLFTNRNAALITGTLALNVAGSAVSCPAVSVAASNSVVLCPFKVVFATQPAVNAAITATFTTVPSADNAVQSSQVGAFDANPAIEAGSLVATISDSQSAFGGDKVVTDSQVFPYSTTLTCTDSTQQTASNIVTGCNGYRPAVAAVGNSTTTLYPSSHALWLPDWYVPSGRCTLDGISGSSDVWVHAPGQPGLWFDDGVTIRYYGTVQNTQNSAYKFEFEFIWNNKRAADVTLIKEELLAVFYTSNVVVPSSWFQYDMFRARMIGQGKLEGTEIVLAPIGPPLQVGVGANGKTLDLGAATWFTFQTVRNTAGDVCIPRTSLAGTSQTHWDLNLILFPADCPQFRQVPENVVVNCNPPPVLNLDCTPSTGFERTYKWDLTKTSNPSSADLFAGESVNVAYNVTAVRTSSDGNYSFSASITINNPSAAAATISSSHVTLSPDPGFNPPLALNCTSTSVPAFGSVTCSVEQRALPDASARTLTIEVVTPANTATKQCSITFSSTPSLTRNQKATVTDTHLTLDPSGVDLDGPVFTWGYTLPHTCSSLESSYVKENRYSVRDVNTARLVSECQYEEAHRIFHLGCYRPSIEKDAETCWTRVHSWNVKKSTDAELVVKAQNTPFALGYYFNVSHEVDDTSFVVSGAVRLYNPHPTRSLTLTNVADALSPSGTPVPLKCFSSLVKIDSTTYLIPPKTTTGCTYSVCLNSAEAQENVFTATLSGTDIVLSAKAAVVFATNPSTEVDASVDLYDVVLDDGKGVNSSWLVQAGLTDAAFLTRTQTFPGFDCPPWNPQCPTAKKNTEYSLGKLITNVAELRRPVGDKSVIASSREDVTVVVKCFEGDLPGTPTASITVRTNFEKNVTWSLKKEAAVPSIGLFAGQTADVSYTVALTTVTKDQGFKIFGSVNIQGPAVDPIGKVNLQLDIGSTQNVPLSCKVDSNQAVVTLPELLTESTTWTCTYSLHVPDASSRPITLFLFQSDTLPVDAEPIATSTAEFDGPKVINAGATLTDPMPEPDLTATIGYLEAPTSRTYQAAFSCPSELERYGNTGSFCESVDNTATLHPTDSAAITSTATVEKCCYAPVLSKTLDTSFTRTYGWTVDKTAQCKDRTAAPDTNVNLPFEVRVGVTPTDSAFKASGTVTVKNPHPTKSIKVHFDSDVLTGEGLSRTVSLSCDPPLVVKRLTLNANQVATCQYAEMLDESYSSLTNTLTVSLPDEAGTGTFTVAKSGAFDPFSPSAEVNRYVNVVDEFNNNGVKQPVASLDGADEYFPPYSVPQSTQVTCPTPEDYNTTVPNKALVLHATTSAELAFDTESVQISVVCRRLQVTVTPQTQVTRKYTWTLTKNTNTGCGSTVTALAGQSSSVDYSVVATRSAGCDISPVISGVVRLRSSSGSIMVTSLSTGISNFGGVGTNCSFPISVGTTDVVCSFSTGVPNMNARVITVVVSTQPNSLVPHVTATANVNFNSPTVLPLGATAVVSDDQFNFTSAGPITVTSTTTLPYSRTLTCPTTGYGTSSCNWMRSYPNNAKLMYNNGQDQTVCASANVVLSCFVPKLTKTSSTAFDRDFTYAISKTVNGLKLSTVALADENQKTTANYNVTVTSTAAESNFQITGSLTVRNPAPISMSVNVSDLYNGQLMVLSCSNGVSPTNLGLAPSQWVTCTFARSLTQCGPNTNTARAVLTSTGVAVTATASVACAVRSAPSFVVVTDSLVTLPLSSQLLPGNTPFYSNYPIQHSCLPCPSGVWNFFRTVVNTATVTLNGQQLASSSATLNITYPCTTPQSDCLSPGYWRTHCTSQPNTNCNNQYDPTWDQLGPLKDKTKFFDTSANALTWVQVLYTKNTNTIDKDWSSLAWRYVPAYMNDLKGLRCVVPSMRSAMQSAVTLFNKYPKPPPLSGTGAMTSADKTLAKSLLATICPASLHGDPTSTC